MSDKSSGLNDYDFIGERIKEIRKAESPMCPRVSSRTLYSCLRSANPCPAECEFKDCWIGEGG